MSRYWFSIRPSHVRTLLFALAISALALSLLPGSSFGAEPEKKDIMVLSQDWYTVSTPGDNLTRLAERFGVSTKAFLAVNPKIANRTDPERRHWIYLGEIVAVPIYALVPLSPDLADLLGDGAMVATPMSVIRDMDTQAAELAKAKEAAKVAEAEVDERDLALKGITDEHIKTVALNSTLLDQNKELESKILELQGKVDLLNKEKLDSLNQENQKLFWAGIILLFFSLAVIIVKMWRGWGSRRNIFTTTKEEIGEKKTLATRKEEIDPRLMTKVSETMDAVALMQSVQKLTGNELVRFANLSAVKDEHGNDVTIKKIRDFMANRSHLDLGNTPLTRWPELLKKDKKPSMVQASATAS